MIAYSDIKNLITTLHFSLEEGTAGIWVKKYTGQEDYIIKVDFTKEEINYGDKIRLGDKTTCNFKAGENFVVLECVNRILEKGYLPENIVLEKDYPLGHKLKGKLDILITDKDNKAYLMIECKTWGTEYDKATKKTLSNGGQLLSYFQQDKSAQYLCLYTSRLEESAIQSKYGIIKVEPEFITATNTEDVFEQWNKNLKDNGIFEASSTPYNIVIKSLTKDRLLPLTKDDSSRLFNQFAEVLRHNVVSDKPNAFNKLITLLLCKIVDEDKGEEEELHFQWLENDTNISLQKRLNDLYKVGMERYLTKVVTDYSDSDVESIVGLDATQRDIIKHMMTELRLKKNNEFAFKEVFNDPSFEENSKVLREVVELFQPYQVRYNKKQQFLGDFFELLLSTSIKQEAGQFFTPVPVARFIINSIPLKELMINKITKGDSDFLPYVIDYAVGSGHFLTEAMDEIHSKVKEIHQSGKYTQPSIKRNLAKWSDDYDWAYDFVYGIEKDYRLVKTAKVSCFLNGDGLARIFNADGLANFQTDADYKDKLKESVKGSPKDNQQFEVLIANPPYSVSAFKNTLTDGEKSFDLYNRLTEDSSEIECLFIERAKQLLKDGGYAGIILPSSILSNGGIYEDAREIILKYFKLVAITEFSSGTFMATGTNTVTLFLERRSNTDWQKTEHAVNTFFTNATDVTCNGIEAPFSKYVAYVYKTISLDDYTSFIRQKPNEAILTHELFVDYRKAFDNSTPVKNLKKKAPFKALSETEQEAELNRLFLENVTKIEKEKLLYFILAHPQKTVLIKANPNGKNEDEKEFLGYEFSNRRGHEGIKAYGAKTIQQATKLYDENSSLNPEKVNTYIYQAFLKKEIEINENLQSNISNQQLVDMLNFERVEFTKSVSLAVKKKGIDYTAVWETDKLVLLRDVATILKGTSITKAETETGRVPVIAGGKEAAYFHNIANRTGTVITVSASGANAGFVNLFTEDIFASDCNTIQSKDESIIPTKLLYYLLKYLQPVITNLQRGQAQPHVYAKDLEKIKVPIISANSQNQILDQLKDIESQQNNTGISIEDLQSQIVRLINNLMKDAPKERLDLIIKLEYGYSLPDRERIKGDYPVMGSNGVIGYHNTYLIESPSIIVGRKGSAGKVTLIEQNSFPIDTTFYVKFNKDKVNYKYLYYLLKSIDLENLALKTGVPGLNRNDVYNKQVPLPTLLLQEEFVKSVEPIEKEIIIYQNQLKQLEKEQEAILKKYL